MTALSMGISVKRSIAIAWGLSGPNLRGSGVDHDVRKANPYLDYHRYQFDIPETTFGNDFRVMLQRGDITIWRHDHNPAFGLIVLAQRKGDHGCTVKQLDFDESHSRPILRSVNQAFDSPEDGTGWGVVARLIGVIRRSGGIERTWYLLHGLRPGHLLA